MMGGCGTALLPVACRCSENVDDYWGDWSFCFCVSTVQLNGRLVSRCFDAITASNTDAEGDDDDQGTETGCGTTFAFA